ncbi:MAG: hypothetical protein B7X97_08430 [Methylotenera sp. 17-45-7]|jgi:hypothetical protein|nr:MAG: hypothetical protein B7Y34_00305 [Methylophilales bacterium 16-45-9]OZA07756.1 MAG: hypothetical protein B7X97_08430 [Methylotenera sp. 17-45-7]
MSKTIQKNVLGTTLQVCSLDPITGFTRNGCCETGVEDTGSHTVCAQMTDEFLAFSLSRGNDLSTPRPEYGFEGLQAGDRWCLCASRWLEASEEGFAPPVILEASHEKCLQIVSLADLKYHELR